MEPLDTVVGLARPQGMSLEVDSKAKGLGGFKHLNPDSSFIGKVYPVIEETLFDEGTAAPLANDLLGRKVVEPQTFKNGLVFPVKGKYGQTISFLFMKDSSTGKPTLSFKKGKLDYLAQNPKSESTSVKSVSVVPMNGKMVSALIDTSEFAKVHFANRKAIPKDVKMSHDYLTQVAYVVGDPWSVIANVDMFRPLINGVPTDPGVMNKFTSSFGVVSGPINYLSAVKKDRAAKVIGDGEGLINAKIGLIRGGVETTSGLIMIAVRTVGLVISRATASKTILVANKVLGYASTAIGCLYYLVMMLPFTINAFRCGSFLSDFNKKKAENDEGAFLKLVEMIGLNSTDLDKVAKVASFSSEEAFYNLVKDGEKLPNSVSEDLTKDEILAVEERFNELYATIDCNDYPLIEDWDQVKNCLLAKMLKEANRLVLKKKVEYTRRAGFGTYTDVRKLMKDSEITFTKGVFSLDGITDKSSVIENVNALAIKEAHKNMLINTLVTFICVIGIASFIAATVFSGGTPFIVAIIVMLISNVMMTGLDLYAFIEELKAMETATNKDMISLAIFIAMSIVSLGVGLVFANSMLARAVITSLGAFMISFQITAYMYASSKLEKKGKAKPEVQIPRDDYRPYNSLDMRNRKFLLSQKPI